MDETGEQGAEYTRLELLEELESLLEELEEVGVSDLSPGAVVPGDLRERLDAHDIRHLQQLRGEILNLHSAIDADDHAAEISES